MIATLHADNVWGNYQGTMPLENYENEESDETLPFSNVIYVNKKQVGSKIIFCVIIIQNQTRPDTLIPNVYDPQSLNRYMFERGNPYKNKDETGHVILAVIGLVAIVAVAAFTIYVAVQYYKQTGELPVIGQGGYLREGFSGQAGDPYKDVLYDKITDSKQDNANLCTETGNKKIIIGNRIDVQKPDADLDKEDEKKKDDLSLISIKKDVYDQSGNIVGHYYVPVTAETSTIERDTSNGWRYTDGCWPFGTGRCPGEEDDEDTSTTLQNNN